MFTGLKFSEDGTVCRLNDFPARHFFTTMRAGNMSLKWDDEKTAQENFARCFSAHGNVLAEIVSILPEHSDNIVVLPHYYDGETEKICDGLMTSSCDTYLVLRPADCFPILMGTIDRKFVGLIHAGWRGTDLEIARLAVKLAVRTYRVEAEDIFIGIGPGIHKCCWDHLADELPADPRWKPFVGEGLLGKYVDLLDFNVKQLLDAGIKHEHIKIAAHCACCAKDKNDEYLFFSHHRAERITGEKEGRFATVISMI
ncbi:MAG: polyphenol oxidase family protein [Patescibacteria group bacterium]